MKASSRLEVLSGFLESNHAFSGRWEYPLPVLQEHGSWTPLWRAAEMKQIEQLDRNVHCVKSTPSFSRCPTQKQLKQSFQRFLTLILVRDISMFCCSRCF